METRLKKVHEQVIVITGASSGIGLTTARLAARKGARLVLAARSESALQELTSEINTGGGQSVYVVADVSRLEDVQRIAAAARSAFGSFDTWVNNAAGSIYGRILDVPLDEERKLFETNYWGVVYGSRIAAEHLRKRGGAIVNVGSVASDRAIPLQAAYSASKHAVKAYTDALRSELEKDGAPVSVTLIKPAAIATPFFRHAKSYMGAQPTAPPPMYAPDVVASAILRAAEHPMRDVLVGGMATFLSAMGRFFPRAGDKFVKAGMFDGRKSERLAEPGDNEIFDHPSDDLRERAEYDVHVCEMSVYTEASMRPAVKTAAVALAALGLSMLVARRLRSRWRSHPASPVSG